MLKRLALLFTATAILAIPATSASAAVPETSGVAPEEACHAAIPQTLQPIWCGQGDGDWPKSGIF